jgi:mono/diheme cytochrome c family protein
LRNFFLVIALILSFAGAMKWGRALAADSKKVALPPAIGRAVDFDQDVKPILAKSCASCHGGGKSKGDFRIDSKLTFIKGGESGPAVIEHDSGKSLVIQLVAGLDDEKIMPKKGPQLTAEQVGILRAWIDQGMRWTEGMTFAAGKSVPLPPREVAVPVSDDPKANPIDLLLTPYFAKKGVKPGALVEDRVFARRVWLDVVGLLPPPEELEAFIADQSLDKREKLVWRLLNDKKAYTEHWLSFWNDLLRNDYKGTGYIDGGRKQITPWLYKALSDNMPFDQFVRELVSGASGSEGFIKGIVWRGVVNAAQTPQMQAAQNISQVFMGANLKCASCHDSFVSQWLLADSYGLAGIYADAPLEMERCGVPQGKVAPMKFLFPELGAIDAKLPRDERLKQLATIITSEKNGRLSRTLVNRLWKKFLGRALVEPVDEMDHEPWNADVLDWLAVDLAKTNKWDVKRTMARILTSKAYQMPVVAVAEGGNQEFVFRGPVVKRLTAEEFVDALASVTGAWSGKAAFDPAGASTKLPHRKAKWVWSTVGAQRSAAAGTIYLRKEIALEDVTSGEAIITCDNRFVLFVNGTRVASGEEWSKPIAVDLKSHLANHVVNVIAIEAENTTNAPSPAGLFVSGKITHRKLSAGAPPVELATDKSWVWSDKPAAGWQNRDFTASGWKPAVELGNETIAPWKLNEKLAEGVQLASGPEVRSALCTADPLTTSLGRSNREQVLTDRASVATTLQALEMSNGSTLAEMLNKGAARLTADRSSSGDQLIERIFVRALGRKPTAAELATAAEMVGKPAKTDGVEDLLWIVAMLPEFQLIR